MLDTDDEGHVVIDFLQCPSKRAWKYNRAELRKHHRKQTTRNYKTRYPYRMTHKTENLFHMGLHKFACEDWSACRGRPSKILDKWMKEWMEE